LKPEKKIVSFVSIALIIFFILSMALYFVPVEYINTLLFGPEDRNQAFYETGVLFSVGNHPKKIAGDNFIHYVIYFFMSFLALISFYLINYPYYKIKKSFNLAGSKIFYMPIFLILSWFFFYIVLNTGGGLYNDATEKSLMISYFLYLTAEAIIYLAYISILTEFIIRFNRLKLTPIQPLAKNQANLTQNSLFN
jgi:hypothetical protein